MPYLLTLLGPLLGRVLTGRDFLMDPNFVGLMPGLTARGESPAAFGRRCIPPGCVAPRSNTPGILTRRALPSGRIAALGATPDFHHGLLTKLNRQNANDHRDS
jgi:hypothetical protein